MTLRKLTEAALRKYGSSTVIADFTAAGPSEKKRLLDAAFANARDKFVMFAAHSQGFPRVGTAVDRNCPLVRALIIAAGSPPHVLDEDAVQFSRRQLAQWGTIRSSLAQYKNMVASQKSGPHYQNKMDDGFLWNITTNKAVIKQRGTKSVCKDWSNLRKIGISELVLFGTRGGCVLEGTIVGEPILPMVGINLLIQDADGQVIVVFLYNFLPEGIRGAEAEPLLQTKLPIGATIRIAEPFMKIFGDGSRGIRADNPSEIQVDIPSRSTSNEDEKELTAAKTLGDQFLVKNQPGAAMEVCIPAIRRTAIVPTFLSSRSQAYIDLEQWGLGLCDAAASLTIRPGSEETWNQYKLCLSKLPQGNEQEVFTTIIDDLFSHQENQGLTTKLEENGEIIHALLSNWALCSLAIGALNDVVAVAAACIRIKADEKVVYCLAKSLAQLGQFNLARRIADLGHTSDNTLGQLQRDLDVMQAKFGNIAHDRHYLMSNLLSQMPPALLPNWIGPIETFVTSNKGRGVRATRDISLSEVVMIQRPVASSAFNMDEDPTHVIAVGETTADTTTGANLMTALVKRSEQDGVLSQILGRLSDGSTLDPPLVPLGKLMLSLDSCPLLLPGHHNYIAGGTGHLDAQKVEGIVRTNVHGVHAARFDRTALYPAVSMMNHKKDANAQFLPVFDEQDVAVVVSNRPVKKGEELCMRYLKDEAAVERKWGKLY